MIFIIILFSEESNKYYKEKFTDELEKKKRNDADMVCSILFYSLQKKTMNRHIDDIEFLKKEQQSLLENIQSKQKTLFEME